MPVDYVPGHGRWLVAEIQDMVGADSGLSSQEMGSGVITDGRNPHGRTGRRDLVPGRLQGSGQGTSVEEQGGRRGS